MSTWLWFLGGVLLLALGTVFAVGAMLPREHVASRSLWIALHPQEVWKIIRNIDGLPTWRTGITNVTEIVGDAQAPTSWVECSGKDQLKIVVDEEAIPSQLVTHIDDKTLPFGGTWTYSLTEEQGGTRVRITEAGFVNPPPFRFISRFILGHTKTMTGYLTDLASKTNSPPSIEA